jgi:hypothetical protein
MQPMDPLPFTYQDVLLILPDAEITHFHTAPGSGSPYLAVYNAPGVHNSGVVSAQLLPNKSPHTQGRPYPSHQFPKADGAPI